jgi:hypothetical protein
MLLTGGYMGATTVGTVLAGGLHHETATGVNISIGFGVGVVIFAAGIVAAFFVRYNPDQTLTEWLDVWVFAGTRNLRRTFQVRPQRPANLHMLPSVCCVVAQHTARGLGHAACNPACSAECSQRVQRMHAVLCARTQATSTRTVQPWRCGKRIETRHSCMQIDATPTQTVLQLITYDVPIKYLCAPALLGLFINQVIYDATKNDNGYGYYPNWMHGLAGGLVLGVMVLSLVAFAVYPDFWDVLGVDEQHGAPIAYYQVCLCTSGMCWMCLLGMRAACTLWRGSAHTLRIDGPEPQRGTPCMPGGLAPTTWHASGAVHVHRCACMRCSACAVKRLRPRLQGEGKDEEAGPHGVRPMFKSAAHDGWAGHGPTHG